MPYLIAPAPAGTDALAHADGVRRCAGCGLIDNRDALRPVLRRAPYKSPHLSQSTDGVLLASRAFQDRYVQEGWQGLRFEPAGKGYAVVHAARTVPLRVERRYLYDRSSLEYGAHPPLPADRILVHHTGSCGRCGRYRQMLGGGARVILRGERPIGATEFVLGDVRLGEDDDPCPDLIAGDALRPAHVRERLRGVSVFTQVAYEPWAGTSRVSEPEGRIIPLHRARTERRAARD